MARKSRKKKGLLEAAQAENAASTEVFIPPRKMILATAAYARLSVENSGNETDDAIQTQIRLIHNYIADHPDLELVDTYVDNGYSGTNFDRPEFERLMRDVRDGKIQCIVVKDLSRFGRDYLETGHYLETIFPRLNVRFVAITDDFDSARPEDLENLATPIKNMINGLYAKDISNKLLSYHEEKRKKGERFATFPTYGYLLTEDRKGYLPDEETVPYVRAIYMWKLMGVSNHEMARRMELLQAPTLEQHWRKCQNSIQSENKESCAWYPKTIYKILRNQVYIGDTVIGKSQPIARNSRDREMVPREKWIITPNTHEGIILRDDFNAVQELSERDRQKRNDALEQRAKDREAHPGLFNGLVYCACCGSPMYLTREIYSYRMSINKYCCRADKRNHSCSGTMVQENLLQILVMDQISLLIKAMCRNKELLQESVQGDGSQNMLLSLKRKAASLSGKISQTEDRKADLYEDWVSGVFDEREYRELKEHYIGEIQQMNKEMQKTLQKQRVLENRIQQYVEKTENLEKHLDGRTFDIELVRALVERIEVAKDDSIAVRFKCKDAYEELFQMMEGEQGEE